MGMILKKLFLIGLTVAGVAGIIFTNGLLMAFSGAFFLWMFWLLVNETDFFHFENINAEPSDQSELFDSALKPVAIQKGRSRAVLFIHGFASSPQIFHRHIPRFEKAGYDVFAPLLPGCGTSPENFSRTNFSQYYAHIRNLYESVRHDYDRFYIVGLSMGGVITLKLLEELDDSLQPTSASVCAAPVFMNSLLRHGIVRDFRLYFIRVVSWFFKIIRNPEGYGKECDGGEEWIGYDDIFPRQTYSIMTAMNHVRYRLSRIKTPLLLIHAKDDREAPFENLWYIASHVSSLDMKIWVPDLSGFEHSHHSLFLYRSIEENLFGRISSFFESR